MLSRGLEKSSGQRASFPPHLERQSIGDGTSLCAQTMTHRGPEVASTQRNPAHRPRQSRAATLMSVHGVCARGAAVAARAAS
eukprot:2846872-Prymnesium_polylepis.2